MANSKAKNTQSDQKNNSFDSKNTTQGDGFSFKIPVDDSTGKIKPEKRSYPPIKSLRLKSITDCRKTLARIIKLYARQEISGETLSKIMYGLQVMTSFWKIEFMPDLEARMLEIERRQKNEQH